MRQKVFHNLQNVFRVRSAQINGIFRVVAKKLSKYIVAGGARAYGGNCEKWLVGSKFFYRINSRRSYGLQIVL